jgi:rare lipoprotein A
MIITTRKLYSSIGFVIALLVATTLFFALPSLAHSQPVRAAVASLAEHGRSMASGESYDHRSMTAVHSSLPFDTMVRVTNVAEGTSVVVRINDRLEPSGEPGIKLSGAAAEQLGIRLDSEETVSLQVLDAEAAIVIVPGRAGSAPHETGYPMAVSRTAMYAARYTLQIGSFAGREAAQSMAEKYEEAWVQPVSTTEGQVYRVFFSRFGDEGPARIAQGQLWSMGQDSFLRAIGP